MDDLKRVVDVPNGCITASALRTLANAMDRLAAFHHERGGPSPDSPCLTDVHMEEHTVVARVTSGARVYRMHLVHGAWEFR